MMKNTSIALALVLGLTTLACTDSDDDNDKTASATRITTPSLDEDFDTLNTRTWALDRHDGAERPVVENGELVLAGAADSGVGGASATFRPGGKIEIFELRFRLDEFLGTVPSFFEVVYDFADADREYEAVLRADATPIPPTAGTDSYDLMLTIREKDGGPIQSPQFIGESDLGDVLEVRFDVNPTLEFFELSIGDGRWRTMIGGIEVPEGSTLGRLHFEVGGNATLAVEEVHAYDRTHESVLNLANLRAFPAQPYRVQYGFSMYDAFGAPIVLDQADIDSRIAVSILEEGQPIDLAESGAVIHPASDLEMDVVLVLDYSRSMADAFGGDGIATMKGAAQTFIEGLDPEHRVGAVAFNDTHEFGSLILPTHAHAAVIDAIYQHDPYNGFSPAWDAAYEGLQYLIGSSSELNSLGMLVLLSDGFDNSSYHGPQDLIDYAGELGTRIYNVGFGNIDALGADQMRRVAAHTGGRYFDSTTTSLGAAFDGIAAELTNNYQFSYVTGRRLGSETEGGSGLPFDLELDLTLDAGPDDDELEPVGSRLLQPIEDRVIPSSIAGETRRGLISIGAQTQIDGEPSTARFVLRAAHVPRDIRELNLRFGPDLDSGVTADDITLQRVPGGILENWNEITGDSDLGFHVDGDELPFGDFGSLFYIDIDLTNAQYDFFLTLIWENDAYEDGTLFYGGNLNEISGDEWFHDILVDVPDQP